MLQRLREAEREVVFSQFAERDGEIITGTVSRVEPRGVILEMGKAEAILPTTDQSASEHYRIGQHVKAYVLEVRRTTRGPLIYVSRTHKNFLRRLFELEVPEIHNGTVEIKAIAREAGSRSKVAVSSRQEGLDPVGATVGQRGGRVQAVVAELGGEKIDIIPWNEDPAVFVANALQPAQVVKVDIDEENRIASVTVPERMLSLAIGREGQNARLAAKLTGWRIDIRSDQAPPREAPHPGSTGRSRPPRQRRRPRGRRAGRRRDRDRAEPEALKPAEPEAVSDRRPNDRKSPEAARREARPSQPRQRRPAVRAGRDRRSSRPFRSPRRPPSQPKASAATRAKPRSIAEAVDGTEPQRCAEADATDGQAPAAEPKRRHRPSERAARPPRWRHSGARVAASRPPRSRAHLCRVSDGAAQA